MTDSPLLVRLDRNGKLVTATIYNVPENIPFSVNLAARWPDHSERIYVIAIGKTGVLGGATMGVLEWTPRSGTIFVPEGIDFDEHGPELTVRFHRVEVSPDLLAFDPTLHRDVIVIHLLMERPRIIPLEGSLLSTMLGDPNHTKDDLGEHYG